MEQSQYNEIISGENIIKMLDLIQESQLSSGRNRTYLKLNTQNTKEEKQYTKVKRPEGVLEYCKKRIK